MVSQYLCVCPVAAYMIFYPPKGPVIHSHIFNLWLEGQQYPERSKEVCHKTKRLRDAICIMERCYYSINDRERLDTSKERLKERQTLVFASGHIRKFTYWQWLLSCHPPCGIIFWCKLSYPSGGPPVWKQPFCTLLLPSQEKELECLLAFFSLFKKCFLGILP